MLGTKKASKGIPETTSAAQKVPYRQIRALFDAETITVYQAYSSAIAIPAVREQSLCASPDFKLGRMTWIKPSWCWMMYRSGYSYKDSRQEHILALKIPHQHFKQLLSHAIVTHGGSLSETEKEKPVRVQWDPERTPALGVLPYRSIQIGISRAIKDKWIKEWIVEIEDVTERARELKRVVEAEGIVDEEELRKRGLLPREEVYVLEQELRDILGMDLKVGE